jgi:hypothetical protein
VTGQSNSGSGRFPTTGPAVTHRSASARPMAAVVWLFAAGTLVWLLAAGATNAAIHAAPWLLLLSWVVYTSQWRPCLRVDGSGFQVINGLRDHQIPFGTVKDIEVRYNTTIWASGKKYVSWGAHRADRLWCRVSECQRPEGSPVHHASEQRTHQPAGDDDRTRCHHRRVAGRPIRRNHLHARGCCLQMELACNRLRSSRYSLGDRRSVGLDADRPETVESVAATLSIS